MDIPIYVINLSQYKYKFINTFKLLQKLNFRNIQRHEACNIERAKELAPKYITYEAFENIFNMNSTSVIPTWGAVGCAISHFEVWKKIANAPYEYGIVSEDDLKTDNMTKAIFKVNQGIHLIKKINHYLKIVLFNANTFNNCQTSFDGIQKVKDKFVKSHFYIMNRHTAKLLCEKILPFNYQVDIQISQLLNQRYDFKVFNLANCGIDQNKEASTVQYRFYTPKQLKVILKQPEDVCKYIHAFLKTKNSYNNIDMYGYTVSEHFCGYHYDLQNIYD